MVFTSRKPTDSEKKFTVTEKDCLAVVHSLRKWRFYLHGETDVVVVTDRYSLKWLVSLKDPRGRFARWMVDIQDFTFTVQYAPGGELVVPDPLSRDSVEKPLCPRCYKIIEERPPEGRRTEAICEVVDSSGLGGGPTAGEFRAAQRDEFGDIEEFARKKSGAGYFVDERGLLRRSRVTRELIVVPEVLVGAVLDALHRSKLSWHYGVRRTTD